MAEKEAEDIMGIMSMLMTVKEKLGSDLSVDNCIITFLAEMSRKNVEDKVLVLENKVAELEEKLSTFERNGNVASCVNVPIEPKKEETCVEMPQVDTIESEFEDVSMEEECPFLEDTPTKVESIQEVKNPNVAETVEPVSAVSAMGMENKTIPFGTMAAFGFPF